MNIKNVEIGDWYETPYGVGRVDAKGGRFPRSVRLTMKDGRIIPMSPSKLLKKVPQPE